MCVEIDRGVSVYLGTDHSPSEDHIGSNLREVCSKYVEY